MGPRLFSVEYDGTTSATRQSSQCFNGATLIQRGIQCRTELHAELIAGFNGATLIQRGIPDHPRGMGSTTTASMGPRLFSVEYARRLGHAIDHALASMGPRLFSVEYLHGAHGNGAAQNGFNGATLIQRGILNGEWRGKWEV